jgi:hypothetical protein
MKNKLAKAMVREQNTTFTENGAVTNKSTLNAVLDFFYHAPARRADVGNIQLFWDAFSEDSRLALKMLFYLRDVRGGKGERESFRLILRSIAKNQPNLFAKLVPYVAYFGRWDDLIEYTENQAVVELILDTLWEDKDSKKPSLLAKWMPSINTSSEDSRKLARRWAEQLELTEREYRKLLSGIRAKLSLVESKMSDNEWNTINYSGVPGRAMKLYGKAFGRHDGDRFGQFIQKAVKGEVKINSGTVYPHELVAKYFSNSAVDNVVEAQWNQLPNYCSVNRNAIAISDVSGSMMGTPIQVSIALAIYLAERNQGAFQNLFMTFSGQPEIIRLTGKTLAQKVKQVSQSNWAMNTNLQAAFTKLLDLAVKNNAPAEDMPEVVFIISDMEFDHCVEGTNLDGIRAKYERAGYKLPMVAFWNVQSRNNQVPATADENGVYLLSGFSPEAFKQALNLGAKNPEELMLEVLNTERYSFVDKIV